MSSYNRVILIGNLTRDPELKYTPKGTSVCKLGLAVNRKWRTEAGEQKEEVTFVDVDVMGKTAEHCGQYLKKGRSAMIEGRLKLDQWDDKATGQKRSKLGVMAESVQFLGGNPEQQEARRTSAASAKSETSPSTDEKPARAEGDDVPF